MLQVSGEEVSKLLVSGIEPIKEIDPCFAEFTYTPRSLSDDSTPMVKDQSSLKFKRLLLAYNAAYNGSMCVRSTHCLGDR